MLISCPIKNLVLAPKICMSKLFLSLLILLFHEWNFLKK